MTQKELEIAQAACCVGTIWDEYEGTEEFNEMVGKRVQHLIELVRNHLESEQPEVDLKKVVMIDNIVMNMIGEGYNDGFKTRPFYEEVVRRINARKEQPDGGCSEKPNNHLPGYDKALLEVKSMVDDLYEETSIGLNEYDSGLYNGIAETCMKLRGFIKARLESDEQPEVDLESAAQHVYESWMGGTMDDVRRDMVELGKVLNARKEESK